MSERIFIFIFNFPLLNTFKCNQLGKNKWSHLFCRFDVYQYEIHMSDNTMKKVNSNFFFSAVK